MKNNIIKVTLGGDVVGQLYWDERAGRAVFNYAAEFVRKGLDVAPLTASIFGAAGKGLPVLGRKEKLFRGLPPFLADSLPDLWGNQLFDQWAVLQGIPRHSITPVDRLAYIGRRAMGAFEFEPAVADIAHTESVDIDRLYRLAKRIFEEREQATVLADESLTLQNLYEVGTSAGGQHPKAILAINEATGDIRSGQIELPPGYRYFILKFAEGDDFPFTLVEMVYHELAREAGIAMMPCQLIEVEGRKHFLTERFDRQNGRKIHTQTLAAMNPDADSYEDLFDVARQLKIPATEQAELFRRMVFNVLGGNVDDHVKNFSFMLDERGQWHITPAYDITFTTNLDGLAYENRHSMTILGKSDGISVADLAHFARRNSIKRSAETIRQVAAALSQFYTFAQQHGVPEYWADRIEEHLASLLPEEFQAAMQHHKPTVVEPYTTPDGFHVSDVRIVETHRHDFRIEATIDGRPHKYIADRKTALAQEIIANHRNKMPPEAKQALVGRYLLPKARRILGES